MSHYDEPDCCAPLPQDLQARIRALAAENRKKALAHNCDRCAWSTECRCTRLVIDGHELTELLAGVGR